MYVISVTTHIEHKLISITIQQKPTHELKREYGNRFVVNHIRIQFR